MFEGGYVSANVLPLITITCDRYWFVGNGETSCSARTSCPHVERTSFDSNGKHILQLI